MSETRSLLLFTYLQSRHRLLPCRSAMLKTTPTTRPKRQHAPITLARVYNANILPTSNLCKNLCSNLYNNFHNNPDLRIVLINSNSHLFLYIHLTSFRRFSVEGEDSYSPQSNYKGGYQRDPNRKFSWREL